MRCEAKAGDLEKDDDTTQKAHGLCLCVDGILANFSPARRRVMLSLFVPFLIFRLGMEGVWEVRGVFHFLPFPYFFP